MDKQEPAPYPDDDAATEADSAVRIHRLLAELSAPGLEPVRVHDQAILGTSASATLRIQDRRASRLHAAVEVRADGVWLRDLGSRNGTFVDRLRIEAVRLRDGCTVHIGSTALTVRLLSEEIGATEPLHSALPSFLGRSVAARSVVARVGQLADRAETVLIIGETGTGKELLARALHDLGPRRGGPFVIVDCGAVQSDLLEAELFGHARGAFTGAQHARPGAFEAASSGSVFLDEVGELPVSMQAKLLRALEARAVRRLGENEYRPIDVRFIAATHRDLAQMVSQREFREDLFFRLAVFTLRVPPLRERLDDIPDLVRAFTQRPELWSDARLAALGELAWPGNVRQLRHHVLRVDAFGHDGADEPRAASSLPPPLPGAVPDLVGPYDAVKRAWLERFERAYLEAMLKSAGGNVSEAARRARIERSYFHRLLKRAGLR